MNQIYIDGLFFNASGIGRYYESILKELLKRKFQIISCVPKKYKNQFLEKFGKYENMEVIFVDYEKFSLKSLLKHHKILNQLEKRADLFFFPHINIPLWFRDEKIVLTIHDFIPFTSYWGRNNIKKLFIRFLYTHSIKKAKRVISISNQTKKDLLTHFNIKKVDVIYNFIDEKFFEYKPKDRIIKDKYILYVGNRKSHKNLKNLILAFNEIKKNIPHKLVIVGKKDKEYDFVDKIIDENSLKDKIIQIDYASDEEIMSLYYYAELFVFPSFYEGFGYPPLEALALDTPVIVSNIEILKEILGEKIACFDPYSYTDIAKKIKDILQNNEKREELLQIGKKRLSNFRAEVIMPKYIEVFKKAIK